MVLQLSFNDNDFHIDVDELQQIEEEYHSDPEDDEVFCLSSDGEDDDEDELTDEFLDEFIRYYEEIHQNENQNEETHISMTSNGNRRKRKEMCLNERKQIAQSLLHNANEHYELRKGCITKIASDFNRHKTTISKFWNKLVKWQVMNGGTINVKSKKYGKVGRKLKTFNEECIKSIPQQHRTTIRAFVAALQISKSVVYRMLKKGVIRSHTNSIKPSLTTRHKIKRMEWVISKIIPRNVNVLPRFHLLSNLIHIDEKWFWLTKLMQRYYLVLDEEEPVRSTQSKNFIPKVMFITAVARPQFDKGECTFDGKIEIWPFIKEHIAKRTTSNRQRGTVEIKALHSVTREVIKETLIKQVSPAIKEKWPTWGSKCIWIQQDNARPHISLDDIDFKEAACTDGFDMHLICHPAQSPGLNVLDLGFFNAIQKIQEKKFPKDINDLVNKVKEAFDDYDPMKLHYNWLQLQYVMMKILKVKGEIIIRIHTKERRS